MSRKKSKYKPRQIIPDTLSWILQGNAPASIAKDVILRVDIANHSALTCLTQGSATKQDVFTLSHAFTTASSLASHNIGDQYETDIQNAQNTLKVILKRLETWGKVQATKQELAILDLALEVHDAQLAIATVAELENAIKKAKIAIQCNHK